MLKLLTNIAIASMYVLTKIKNEYQRRALDSPFDN